MATDTSTTKEQLLDKAEALFARKGYRGVPVREITRAARCNLAAVNYHFGNKENLYREVFHSRWIPRIRQVHEFYRKTLASRGKTTPETILRSLAEAYLLSPLSEDERQRYIQLLAREMAHPTEVFNKVAENILIPFLNEVSVTLKPVLPGHLNDEQLRLSIISIFTIIQHFSNMKVAVTHVTGREYDKNFKAILVEHIVRFSLQGLGVSGRCKP
ncbi:MAG: CerR family C-terminal domain-containing protein [Desulfatiglandales bacterium]